MAAAASNSRSSTPVAIPSTPSPPPEVNETLYKPYKKYSINGATIKRKKRLFIQAGIVPGATDAVRTVFETLKAMGDVAPLKNTVVLPPDDTGDLNRFISQNTTPSGLRFCAPSTRSGITASGVGGPYAERNPLKPDNILLTARRRVDNLKSTQAFITLTPPRYEGETAMKIDLLCAKHTPEIDNVGAYLIAFAFLLSQRIGISKITLGAVPDRVGYYKRLGFRVVPSHSSLIYMEMGVPPMEADNLVFEENENVGFVEAYPSVVAAVSAAPAEGGGSAAAASASASDTLFEEEPENKPHNVFGGRTVVSNKNLKAAKTNNMSAFTRRTRRSRTKYVTKRR